MRYLHLGIFEGDVNVFEFNDLDQMCDYLHELKSFDCIWLATNHSEIGEIVVTENLQKLIRLLKIGYFDLNSNNNEVFHVQEYQTYEDAYKVALDMREGNPKCYS
jgi:hypothetical protein